MKQLSPDWLVEGLIDAEYKKYLLLAYLQDVRGYFHAQKLYPHLGELVSHYRNLLAFRDRKESLADQFPKQITKADWQKLELTYQRVIEDDELMAELEEIIGFAVPQLEDHLSEGRALYDYVEQHLEIAAVGLSPLEQGAGYLFVSTRAGRDTFIYEYTSTLFEAQSERYRGLRTVFLQRKEKSISQTYERMKRELIDTRRELPNPPTYLVESALVCPLEETLLPMAKRLLMRQLSEAA